MVLFDDNDYMATVPERSRFRHNFALPKWGIQRHMKCIKGDYYSSDGSGRSGVTSDHHQQSGYLDFEFANSSVVIPLRLNKADQSSHQLQKSPSKSKESEEEIKEIVRYKTAESLFSKDAVEDDVEDQEKKKPETKENRVREPIRAKELRTEEKTVTRKSARSVMAKAEGKDPVKFSIKLSRKEIEEDFMQMMGCRPPRRPKKRPRTVQKQLDDVFPGLYLTEITPDLYKVQKNPERS